MKASLLYGFGPIPLLCIAVTLACSSTGAGKADSTGEAEVRDHELVAGDALDERTPDTFLPEPVPAEEVMTPGPFGVGVLSVELVDETRVTPAHGKNPELPARTLPTHVWYPAHKTSEGPREPQKDAAAAEGGPWPLVIYCHGFSSRYDENTAVATLLASRGFIVASANFPLTGMSTSGGATAADVVNQPGDVRFLIDAMLTFGNDPTHPLFGKLDPQRIGVMGVSLGGMTAVVSAFHEALGDPRIQAVAAAAAPGCYLTESFFQTRQIPLLLLHGTGDAVVAYPENGPATYHKARGPKYFLSIVGGTHTAMAGLARPMFSLLGNTDAIGCDALAGNPSVSAEALATLSQEFGGVDYEQALTLCPVPCTAPATDQPIDGLRQLELVEQSLVAFFVGTLAPDPRFLSFLRTELTRDAKDASMVFEAPGPTSSE
jgi:predicted dienelactone hydrolase